MIPIGNGNLYVEPIYLQAETSQLPELKRVVLVNGNRIAMEPTLARSIEVIFGQAPPSAPTTDTGTAPPTLSPTPVRTSGPGTAVPTATPRPATPGSAAELARQAEEAFQRAEIALRSGDLAGYQREVQRAQELIKEILQQPAP
jgi:uncharacterized membrane protein (UPF0182 family)